MQIRGPLSSRRAFPRPPHDEADHEQDVSLLSSWRELSETLDSNSDNFHGQ